jgi:hypothetical protein
MAGDAILVEDRADIAAELDRFLGAPVEERAYWPN